MTDVLLASCYFIKDDPKQLEKMQPYPPLATLFAAGHLRSTGRSVTLFDATLSSGIEEFERALETHRPRYVALYEDSFHFLLKMCLLHVREASNCMAKLAKA